MTKKKTKSKIKDGRPSEYRDDYAEKAFKLCLLGATDEEIANFFEVDVRTVGNWKNKHPDFFQSLKKGKLQADSEIASRLYERAMGYEHDDIELKVVSDGKDCGSHVEEVPIRKIYAPDTTAAIFWLKNRQPKQWRDKIDHEVAGNPEKPVEHSHSVKFSKMTDDELNRFLAARKEN